jgi:thiamine-monophosphate kinase
VTESRLVSALGERGLIERIRHRLPPAPSQLIVGPGDDAAVIAGERGALHVLTTDALVEGIHFDRRFSSPADIGHKALAVNVSDVAAMGGTAQIALLSLMLPDSTTVEAVDGVLDGLLALAGALKVAVAGGNITRSPGPLVIDVTVMGYAKPRKVLTRSGGKPGDILYVSGAIGGAAAGLDWLRASDGRRTSDAPRATDAPRAEPPTPAIAGCVRRHRRPEPRTRLGSALGRMRAASACMDLSDGLADAVHQIAEASGTGARIDASKLPLDPGAIEWFSRSGSDPIDRSLRGGDDYELLFSVPARRRSRLRGVFHAIRGLSLTAIGELTSTKSIELMRDGAATPLPAGFSHF